MGINEMGFEVFEEMLDYADELQIEVHELENGTIVADAGVKAKGGYGAGVYLSRLCLADLAEIQLTPFEVGGILLPGVQVATDHPAISCMASQCAMWQVKADKFFAMGSGPARVLARKTRELYDKIGYEECSDVGVVVLETGKIPDEKVASQIAEQCGIDPADLRIAIAPTDSVAGLVQVSARVVETGLHKLFTMGFDINTIKSGWGRAPISPVTGDATQLHGLLQRRHNLWGRDLLYTEIREPGGAAALSERHALQRLPRLGRSLLQDLQGGRIRLLQGGP